mgnify:FL=1
MDIKIFLCDNIKELDNITKKILQHFNENKFFAVSGNLGAGKTTFIKTACKLLGVKEIVNSPTFALVNEYYTIKNEPIYHFDFYRINNVNEAFDIGYEEYFFSGNYCFVEWPEKIQQLLPENFVNINIKEINNNIREFYCWQNTQKIKNY